MARDSSKASVKTVSVRLYEGLFLVDSAQAAADWDAVISAVTALLEKAKAEIVFIRKWDERKLAYKIRGETRGTYILCYFRVDSSKIQQLERNIQLSPTIWRALILNAEAHGAADVEREAEAMIAKSQDHQPEKETAESSDEQRPETAEPEPADSVESAEQDATAE